MVFKWLDRGWMERRLKAWSVQWSGGLPHFSFPNPFSTGVEGLGKWFLFGQLGCLFSEPAEFCSPAVPLTWLLRLRMSLFSLRFISCHHREHLPITPSSYSIRCISPETHTCHLPLPPPPSLCLLGDVKMILRPGKRFMFRTQISLGKLSLPGQFSCLAKHLKGSIRKKKLSPALYWMYMTVSWHYLSATAQCFLPGCRLLTDNRRWWEMKYSRTFQTGSRSG